MGGFYGGGGGVVLVWVGEWCFVGDGGVMG